MRELTWGNAQVSMSKYIAHERVTRGTETSKYPEEEKETSIFLVAASERERGQTGSLLPGLWTFIIWGFDSRRDLESSDEEGKIPVGEIK